MPSLRQRLGAWLKPRLPVNPWGFMTGRVESNAILQLQHASYPLYMEARR